EGMDAAIVDVESAAAEAVADEVRAKGRKAIALRCDVSERASGRDMAGRVLAELGAVHVVCNNAGVVSARPAPEMTEADWDWVMGVALEGVIYGVQAFLPGFVAQGEGHFVNTASIAGLVPAAAPNILSYTV